MREGERQTARKDDPEVSALRRKLAEREEELAVRTAEHKRASAQYRKDNTELKRNVDKATNAAKHSRAKLVQAENELAIARKRLQVRQFHHCFSGGRVGHPRTTGGAVAIGCALLAP